MRDFKSFATAIAERFKHMSKGELYVVDASGDQVWDAYLKAFPSGENPIFRVRTEHDGSYDRNVIRRIGNVVSISDSGELSSVWDAKGLKYPYDVVAAYLSEFVRVHPVVSVLRSKERTLGYVSTTEYLKGDDGKPDGRTINWNHFHADIAATHHCKNPEEVIGEMRTTVEVFKRGLEEITPSSLETIQDLISEGNLYRGDEFKKPVADFAKLQREYRRLNSDQARSIMLWKHASHFNARFRNTVIGSLAVDLSEGILDVDAAVRSFESKVAPTSYKRPKAIITKAMADQAMKTIQELGLEPALYRRHAVLEDVSVNDVLWAGNSARGRMKDGIAGILDLAVSAVVKEDPVAQDISIEDFISDVLPKTHSMEALFRGSLQKNLVSITAPVHGDASPLFKWDSGFAWSYAGDVTDSIKERVKRAGGNIQADLRISLGWFNYDDLDIHAVTPYGHICFHNKMNILDVDMNAGGPKSRTAVENLAFNKPRDGSYRIHVNQFNRRETIDVGFVVEMEFDGRIEQLSYDSPVTGNVDVISFDVVGGKVTDIRVPKNIKRRGASIDVWGLKTETYVPVSTVMLSPNFWSGRETGNKHFFFMLEGCLNDQPVRGIYNEFLRPELEKHRKVFEVLGNRTKCEPSDRQLSGLGFSSTQRENLVVRAVGDKMNRLYNIQF